MCRLTHTFELLQDLTFRLVIPTKVQTKEIKIIHRLFLVNCYLLHVPRLPSQPASTGRGWVIDFILVSFIFPKWLCYKIYFRNNLSIILISLGGTVCELLFFASNLKSKLWTKSKVISRNMKYFLPVEYLIMLSNGFIYLFFCLQKQMISEFL